MRIADNRPPLPACRRVTRSSIRRFDEEAPARRATPVEQRTVQREPTEHDRLSGFQLGRIAFAFHVDFKIPIVQACHTVRQQSPSVTSENDPHAPITGIDII